MTLTSRSRCSMGTWYYGRVAASESRLGEGDGYPLCQSDSTAGLRPEVARLPVSVDAMQQARIAARP